jgi:hypothetical protein
VLGLVPGSVMTRELKMFQWRFVHELWQVAYTQTLAKK